MKRYERSANVTLWANRLVLGVLAAFLFTLPMFLEWYARQRELEASAMQAILIAFYGCAVFLGLALVDIELLLRNILASQVFTRKNVKLIRVIRWCCLAVSLICFPAAFFYLPLVFVVLIMGFLWLMVSVVADVLDTAVTIREENDLTV